MILFLPSSPQISSTSSALERHVVDLKCVCFCGSASRLLDDPSLSSWSVCTPSSLVLSEISTWACLIHTIYVVCIFNFNMHGKMHIPKVEKMHSSNAWYTFFFMLSAKKIVTLWMTSPINGSEWSNWVPAFHRKSRAYRSFTGNIILCVGCVFVALIVKIYVSIGSGALSEWAMKIKWLIGK